MQIAHAVSTRATCDRKHVGCVIAALDRSILATGYNGSPPGMPHCDDVGHDLINDHCVRTTHAEINAIAQAARRGTPLADAAIYINTFPCWNCMKVIATTGIRAIYFDDEYRMDERVIECAKVKSIALNGPKTWGKGVPPF